MSPPPAFHQATTADTVVGLTFVLLAIFIWTYWTMWTIVTVKDLLGNRKKSFKEEYAGLRCNAWLM